MPGTDQRNDPLASFNFILQIDKVRVGPPPVIDVDRYRQGATVTIRMVDGRSFSNTVFAPKGAGLLGIAWDDIDAKYRMLMPSAGVAGPDIEASLALIHGFAGLAEVRGLIGLLRGAGSVV